MGSYSDCHNYNPEQAQHLGNIYYSKHFVSDPFNLRAHHSLDRFAYSVIRSMLSFDVDHRPYLMMLNCPFINDNNRETLILTYILIHFLSINLDSTQYSQDYFIV